MQNYNPNRVHHIDGHGYISLFLQYRSPTVQISYSQMSYSTDVLQSDVLQYRSPTVQISYCTDVLQYGCPTVRCPTVQISYSPDLLQYISPTVQISYSTDLLQYRFPTVQISYSTDLLQYRSPTVLMSGAIPNSDYQIFDYPLFLPPRYPTVQFSDKMSLKEGLFIRFKIRWLNYCIYKYNVYKYNIL